MKLDNNSKTILFAVLILAVIGTIFIYNQKSFITIVEDEVNPSQKSIENKCTKFNDIKNEFKSFIPSQGLQDFSSKKIINLKLSDKGPIEAYKSINSLNIELSEKNKDEISNFFATNIEPKLKKLGLIKLNSYSFFNLDYYQYRQDDSYYLIAIPTNRESAVSIGNLELNCGEVDEKLFIQYSRIRSYYNENYALAIWEATSKVLVVNVNEVNTISGSYNIYDLTGKTPELIYQGQEQIKCSILKEKNLNEKNLQDGITCLND